MADEEEKYPGYAEAMKRMESAPVPSQEEVDRVVTGKHSEPEPSKEEAKVADEEETERKKEVAADRPAGRYKTRHVEPSERK